MRKTALDLAHRQVELGEKVGVPTGKRGMAKATVIKITGKGCRVNVEHHIERRDNITGKLVPDIWLEERVLPDFNFVKLELPTQGVFELWET